MSQNDQWEKISARRAVFNVFVLSGTFFALIWVGMYFIKGGSLLFAIELGYGTGGLVAVFYYANHRHQFPAHIQVEE